MKNNTHTHNEKSSSLFFLYFLSYPYRRYCLFESRTRHLLVFRSRGNPKFNCDKPNLNLFKRIIPYLSNKKVEILANLNTILGAVLIVSSIFLSFVYTPDLIGSMMTYVSPYQTDIYLSLIQAILLVTSILFGFFLTIIIPIMDREIESLKDRPISDRLTSLAFLLLPCMFFMSSLFFSISAFPGLSTLAILQSDSMNFSAIRQNASDLRLTAITEYANFSNTINSIKNRNVTNLTYVSCLSNLSQLANGINTMDFVIKNSTEQIAVISNRRNATAELISNSANKGIEFTFLATIIVFVNLLIYFIFKNSAKENPPFDIADMINR